MATVETVFSTAIPEQILPRAIRTQQKKDPFSARLIRTSNGVKKLGVTSAGYRWERIVSKGLAGVFRHVSNLGPTIVSGAQPIQIISEAQTYPAALEASQPGYERMVGTLALARGNIVLDEAILKLENHDAILVDHFENLMEGVGLNVALNKLACYYTPSSTTRHIGTVSSWVLVDDNNGNFIPAEGNEVLYHEGQMVQFYEAVSASLFSHRHTATGADNPGVQIMVTAVDPVTRRVYVTDINGTGLLNVGGNAVADDDIVVFQGQLSQNGAPGGPGVGTAVTPLGCFGHIDWLVNSGTLLGLTVNQYPRVLKSFIKSNLGGPWTELEADRHLTWYYRWHSRAITDLYATPGVWQAYKNTMLGMFQADRTGKPAQIVGGTGTRKMVLHTGFTHVHDGREVTYWATSYMRSGTIIGLVMDNGNFQELHPTRDPSAQRGGGFGSEVEFKAAGDGAYRSIFRPVVATGPNGGPAAMTTLYEAPFKIHYQVWPMDQIPGLLVNGATESNWSA